MKNDELNEEEFLTTVIMDNRGNYKDTYFERLREPKRESSGYGVLSHVASTPSREYSQLVESLSEEYFNPHLDMYPLLNPNRKKALAFKERKAKHDDKYPEEYDGLTSIIRAGYTDFHLASEIERRIAYDSLFVRG